LLSGLTLFFFDELSCINRNKFRDGKFSRFDTKIGDGYYVRGYLFTTALTRCRFPREIHDKILVAIFLGMRVAIVCPHRGQPDKLHLIAKLIIALDIIDMVIRLDAKNLFGENSGVTKVEISLHLTRDLTTNVD
jgi:hypothetical protein